MTPRTKPVAIHTTPAMPAAPLSDAAKAAPWHILSSTDIGVHHGAILDTAHDLKQQAKLGPLPQLLAGVAVALIFEKHSTRTRVSFEVGIQKLGGIVTALDGHTSQLGRGESLEDTAGVLSRYVDAIVYRAKDHTSAAELAEHASVPIVNALTDLEHPCQILADFQTLDEHWNGTHGNGLAGKTLAYIGDGNNMCHSYMLAAPFVGMNVHIATPPGFGPDPAVFAHAKELADHFGTKIVLTHDVHLAVAGADAVATDTWVSMGDEEEKKERLSAFQGYTIDDALMNEARSDAVFMHCLPGHWGEEATHEVAHGPRSLVFDQAENRMWAQMALLAHLIAPKRVSS